MSEDRKFRWDDERKAFVNRISGEAIPDDEPVILFRARDRRARPMLHFYLGLCKDPHHQQAVMDRIGEFEAFQSDHPERMKEPGITRHIRLNSDPAPPPMTNTTKDASPPDLREQVARIIDPHFAKMLDRGELNQHGHEVWGLVLAKADDILALVAPPAGRREAGDLERLAELRFPDPVLTTAKQERNALIDRILSALKANPHA